MSNVAIRVENLSKAYRISHLTQGQRSRYKTLQEEIVGLPRRAWQAVRGAGEEHETVWALRDVSFEVREGDVVGIIGRNGAGKSTLLKILSRITEPTDGQADLYGRVGSLLEVGTGFHPELTGRENVYLSGAVLGMRRSEITRRFDEIVEFAGVEQFIDTPVKRFSSGMYMRLAFSVAAHLEPEILIVDEVLAVGDLEFQQKCLGKMGDVARGGRTVLFVSHNMDAVRKLCTRAAILAQGRLTYDGTTDAAIAQYVARSRLSVTTDIPLPQREGVPGYGLRLALRNEEDEPRAEFHLDEPWRAIIDFRMTESAAHVIAALGLLDAQGTPIVTYWSEPADLSPGDYRVEFAISLPFASSQFSCVIGLSTYERTFYALDRIGQVDILDVALGKQPVRARGAGLLIGPDTPSIRPQPVH